MAACIAGELLSPAAQPRGGITVRDNKRGVAAAATRIMTI